MKKIKLFDYQEDMKERIEKALRLHRSVMAQMPTGTGKTYLLTAVIASFVSNNCLLYTSPSPRDGLLSRMPSSA